MKILAVELLFEAPPELSKGGFLAAVQRFAPQVALLEGDEDSPLCVKHPDFPGSQEGEGPPAQTVFFLEASASQDAVPDYSTAIEQAWDFKDAAAAVQRGQYSGLLTELVSQHLTAGQRLEVFHRTLDGLLSVLKPTALHWAGADRLTDPAKFRNRPGHSLSSPVDGAINVRMFRITNEAGETDEVLMDTLGLHVFGLPDVQCHFRDLEPGRVGGFLYNLGAYLFERGDVIEDGHTVQGLDVDQVWRCQHEEALVGPAREVLDVCPHLGHAGGGREGT